ncbi:MAG: M23 family metallopeptidase [Candidatus Baltobacteraceae bacterium]
MNSPIWLAAFACYFAAVIVASFIVRYSTVQQRALWASVFIAVIAGFANAVYPGAAPIGFIAAAVSAFVIAGWAIYDRRFAASRWLARASGAIVLRPPFEGQWHVAAGGPDPKHNHHQRVSDQYFAYDFLRDEGESWNAPILAPCRGLIAHIEDRHDDAAPGDRHRDRRNPFGNYVSIETPRGYIILAHLQRGTIVVRNGAPVGVGEEVARCGNSGNTRGAHLHIHAQDKAFADIGVAQGVPIAFVSGDCREPMLLEFGDSLGKR